MLIALLGLEFAVLVAGLLVVKFLLDRKLTNLEHEHHMGAIERQKQSY